MIEFEREVEVDNVIDSTLDNMKHLTDLSLLFAQNGDNLESTVYLSAAGIMNALLTIAIVLKNKG